jgi:hypothetical protein
MSGLSGCVAALRRLEMDCRKETNGVQRREEASDSHYIDTALKLECWMAATSEIQMTDQQPPFCCLDCEWQPDKAHAKVSVISLSFAREQVPLRA